MTRRFTGFLKNFKRSLYHGKIEPSDIESVPFGHKVATTSAFFPFSDTHAFFPLDLFEQVLDKTQRDSDLLQVDGSDRKGDALSLLDMLHDDNSASDNEKSDKDNGKGDADDDDLENDDDDDDDVYNSDEEENDYNAAYFDPGDDYYEDDGGGGGNDDYY